jgi:hypothetical protein
MYPSTIAKRAARLAAGLCRQCGEKRGRYKQLCDKCGEKATQHIAAWKLRTGYKHPGTKTAEKVAVVYHEPNWLVLAEYPSGTGVLELCSSEAEALAVMEKFREGGIEWELRVECMTEPRGGILDEDATPPTPPQPT